MILKATHRTRYSYPGYARESYNEVRLMPATDSDQVCLDYDLRIEPRTEVFSYAGLGGTVQHFSLRGQHSELEVVATARVETLRRNPYEGLDFLNPGWDFYAAEETHQAYAEFLCDSRYVRMSPRVRELAESLRKPDVGVTQYLLDLNRGIHDILRYDPDATHVHTTVDEVLDLHAGVCQDYAHLMIACCRSMGIPARYVSGYLYGGDGIRGENFTHAWLECVLPDSRWLGLDPTNSILANDHHIRIFTGRDYEDAAPLKGIYTGPAAERMEVSVSVEPEEVGGQRAEGGGS